MDILQACALFIAAALAGALNSVAGGGSFISFPALVTIALVPDINANATNTVAIWPGAVASVGGYRRELSAQRNILIPLAIVSVIGGVIGAMALLNTPQVTFKQLVPFLLLFATLLFTFSGTLMNWIKANFKKRINVEPSDAPGIMSDSRLTFLGVLIVQSIIAFYGGFFGGGIGIMMLAALRVLGMENIHEMNALKMLLSAIINGVAVLLFVTRGIVYWPQAVIMVIGAIIGGYGGASIARTLNPLHVRRFVIVVGFAMTFYFFFLRQ
jgi:uncharacterized membrane protein YfcA